MVEDYFRGVNYMKKEDLKFKEVNEDNGYIDYWFFVEGETAKELTDKYMEQGMIGVTEVVYSKDEDIVGVKRQFPWNFDVIIDNNSLLKELLKSIISSL
jgi:hypothetical protein